MTTIKTYILDTNVLLSDPNALFSFEENDIVLPLIVIEELDHQKDRQDEVGRNARETVRKLTELVKGHTDLQNNPIELESGGRLFILSSQVIDGVLPAELDITASGDNKILAFCKGLQAKNPEVILVSRDMLIRLKAETLGIHCQDYKKFSVTTSASALYNGVKCLSGQYDIDALYASNRLPANQFLTPEDVKVLNPNQFLVVKQEGTDRSVLARYTGTEVQTINGYSPCKIEGRNKEQKFAIDLLLDPAIKLTTVVGSAGTGKTLLAIAAGLHLVLDGKKYKSLVVCRPIQPVGKDIGYLPGTMEEKMEPWIAPIKDNLRFLLAEGGKRSKRGEETMEMLFENGTIEVEAMTFIRGRSIANAYMIIDEAQNLNVHELKTIITRVGEGTKIVLTGDIEQIDNMYVDSVSNGLTVAIEKFKDYAIAGHVTLTKGERSELATLAAQIL